MKVCESCGEEIDTKDGENRCGNCDESAVQKKREQLRNRRANRKARDRPSAISDLSKSEGHWAEHIGSNEHAEPKPYRNSCLPRPKY